MWKLGRNSAHILDVQYNRYSVSFSNFYMVIFFLILFFIFKFDLNRRLSNKLAESFRNEKIQQLGDLVLFCFHVQSEIRSYLNPEYFRRTHREKFPTILEIPPSIPGFVYTTCSTRCFSAKCPSDHRFNP